MYLYAYVPKATDSKLSNTATSNNNLVQSTYDPKDISDKVWLVLTRTYSNFFHLFFKKFLVLVPALVRVWIAGLFLEKFLTDGIKIFSTIIFYFLVILVVENRIGEGGRVQKEKRGKRKKEKDKIRTVDWKIQISNEAKFIQYFFVLCSILIWQN